MALTQPQLDALRVELQTDPTALGYASRIASGNFTGLADLINTPRAGISVRRSPIRGSDLFECYDIANWRNIGVNAAERTSDHNYLIALAALPTQIELVNADGTDTKILGNLRTIFASLPATLNAINAIATKTGSRAEKLFYTNVIVTIEDIALALAV